jgi:predicted dehydrogenase
VTAPAGLGRAVRLGYVGAGNLAQKVHLPNFAAIAGCDLVALAEVRRDLGERVAQRYGIPRRSADHRELAADPEIDAVAVSAPFALQGEIARDCLLAGKHVFMEKPMAVSLAQADGILAAEREGGARLMVAYMKRYDAGNELVHATVRQWRRTGELGSPRVIGG